MSATSQIITPYHLQETQTFLRVVIAKHGDYLLYHAPLRSSEQVADIIIKLKDIIKVSHGKLMSLILTMAPFITPVIYTATISPVVRLPNWQNHL